MKEEDEEVREFLKLLKELVEEMREYNKIMRDTFLYHPPEYDSFRRASFDDDNARK